LWSNHPAPELVRLGERFLEISIFVFRQIAVTQLYDFVAEFTKRVNHV
jgi:hypothetical protein